MMSMKFNQLNNLQDLRNLVFMYYELKGKQIPTAEMKQAHKALNKMEGRLEDMKGRKEMR